MAGLFDELHTSQGDYYGSEQNSGNYQFITLDDIIQHFMFVYVGDNKILTKVNKSEVQFHAMRAVQEMSYDVLRSIKSFEFTVASSLVSVLPHDYVNYSKVVRVDSNGIEKPIYPTGKTSNPFNPNQAPSPNDHNFTTAGGSQSLEQDTDGVVPASDTWDRFNSIPGSNASQDSDDTDYLRFDNRGRRYGLDPQHAQANGTFFINRTEQGEGWWIHFSSDLAGETVILKYISDSLGTDDEMLVHKFCEEAMYKWIMYGLISGRSNVPEGVVQRFKKEKFAETRKAKIRLSNIRMEEFTQILKGISKPIK